jgi:hypothetical protein
MITSGRPALLLRCFRVGPRISRLALAAWSSGGFVSYLSARSRARLRTLGWLAAGLAAPPAAAAQNRIEITPFLASYYTLSNLTEQNGVPLRNLPGTPPGSIVQDQENAPAFGLRVSYPVSGLLRVEGEFAYAPSYARLSQVPRLESYPTLGTRGKAHVFMASARGVFRPRRSNFFGTAGLGLVSRGGEFWDDQEADPPTRLAGVLGVGVRAAVSPKLTLVFSAETYLYSFSVESLNLRESDSRFQSDVLFSVGVPIGTR